MKTQGPGRIKKKEVCIRGGNLLPNWKCLRIAPGTGKKECSNERHVGCLGRKCVPTREATLLIRADRDGFCVGRNGFT